MSDTTANSDTSSSDTTPESEAVSYGLWGPSKDTNPFPQTSRTATHTGAPTADGRAPDVALVAATGRRKRPWGLRHIVMAFLALLVGQIVATPILIGLAIAKYHLDPNSPTFDSDVVDAMEKVTLSGPGLVVTLFFQYLAFVGAPLWASYRKGHRSLAKDFGLRFKKFDPLIGLGVAVGMQLVMIGASYLLNRTSLNLDAADNTGQVTDQAGGSLAIMIVTACLIAPFTEELLFRGLTLRAALRRFARLDLAPLLPGVTDQFRAPVSRARRVGGTIAAVVFSAALFGSMHFQMGTDSAGNPAFTAGSVVLMMQTGLLGLVFALIALRTRRIGITISAHVFFNSASLAMVFLTR